MHEMDEDFYCADCDWAPCQQPQDWRERVDEDER